ncbi:AAA family ATPase [Thioalkalivibrio sp.]|uniref:AAA family ATPase n=1 Tax=Thioalkalivibrio sp. TaxID=2093813 RepID=UPI003563FD21
MSDPHQRGAGGSTSNRKRNGRAESTPRHSTAVNGSSRPAGWGAPDFDAIPLREGRFCVTSEDKIPLSPTSGRRISTKEPETWGSFEQARAAIEAGRGKVIGRLVERDGIAVVDLDDCVADDGFSLEPWAERLVNLLDSYVEFSPSGTGLRVLVQADGLPHDFTNARSGVEVYKGDSPRYATLTGHVLHNRPIKPPSAEAIKELYQYATKSSKAEDAGEMPPLLDEAETLRKLRKVAAYLTPEERGALKGVFRPGTDRSKLVAGLMKRLALLGLDAQERLSVAFHLPGPMAVALDHRRQNQDKALVYLWEHHVAKSIPYEMGDPAEDFEDFDDEPDDTNQSTNTPGGMSRRSLFMDGAELQQRLRPTEWQIDAALETDSTGMVVGLPGSLKSFFALDLLLATASGRDWHGHAVRQGVSICFAGEGANGLARRVAAWCRQHDVDMATLPIFISRRAVDLFDPASAKQAADEVAAIAREHGPPRIVAVDTLAKAAPGAEENSAKDMGLALRNIDRLLREPYGATVLIVHHTGHGAKDRARGSSALRANVDFEYRLERHERLTDLVSLRCSKMKDGPAPPERWFRAEVVEIPLPAEFDELSETSLVLLPADTPGVVEQPRSIRGKNQRLALTILLELAKKSNDRVPVSWWRAEFLRRCSAANARDAWKTAVEANPVTAQWRIEGEFAMPTRGDGGDATTEDW